jgi:histidine ammonia-lyase
MGMNAALKTRQILDNAYGVIGIELIAGAQALDFRGFSFGKGTQAAHDAVRKVVEHLDIDRPLFPDHNNMIAAVKNNDILNSVESNIGSLLNSW